MSILIHDQGCHPMHVSSIVLLCTWRFGTVDQCFCIWTPKLVVTCSILGTEEIVSYYFSSFLGSVFNKTNLSTHPALTLVFKRFYIVSVIQPLAVLVACAGFRYVEFPGQSWWRPRFNRVHIGIFSVNASIIFCVLSVC